MTTLTQQSATTAARQFAGMQTHVRKTAGQLNRQVEEAPDEQSREAAIRAHRTVIETFEAAQKKLDDTVARSFATITDLEAASDILIADELPEAMPEALASARAYAVRLAGPRPDLAARIDRVALSARSHMAAAHQRHEKAIPAITETQHLLDLQVVLQGHDFDKEVPVVKTALTTYRASVNARKALR